MLAAQKQVADLQHQLAQAKAHKPNLPPDTTAAHAGADITAALRPEVGRTDTPEGFVTSESSDEDAADGNWPDGGTEGASGVDTPTKSRVDGEVFRCKLSHRPRDEENEHQPLAKRPRQLESTAASREPAAAVDPMPTTRMGGQEVTGAAAEVGRDDQLDNARGCDYVIDGQLGLTKAAGESDAEYVLRAGRYDIRKDEEWRQNTSATTEAANLKLAIQWAREDAASGSRRENSRRRRRTGPK